MCRMRWRHAALFEACLAGSYMGKCLFYIGYLCAVCSSYSLMYTEYIAAYGVNMSYSQLDIV